ncbi:peptidoglycan D,D-transpeptidase FtsI family protein [Candidatus Soleaferrea massiliensis]|uniref:peptidoglycan D,D-transpeptidase FtsI family protein n=1 Tax=Candidatus Soleaferrea massiliensis TaxID=1470354 RepID=UPI00058CD143|nr:penicillin-binding transpeptidase domain-containing protein [Candidatus Soleaferrea massiliensis]
MLSTKRVVSIFCLFLLLMGGLFVRLYFLSTGEELASAAQKQSSYTLTVDQTRGYIYDCSMQPLVYLQPQYKAAVLPSNDALSTIAPLLEGSERNNFLTLNAQNKPFLQNLSAENVYGKGVRLFKTDLRYGDDPLAEHLIGYLDATKENGVSGIEKSFNELLKEGAGKLQISYSIDATGSILTQKQPEVTQENYQDKKGVVLTLDRQIQQIAQNAAKKYIKEGAVVVMDVSNGDIKAAVSCPSFNPNNVADSLQDANGPLVNRALSAYNVGSPFKLLIAAAALESGIPASQTFECTGSVKIGDIEFHCHKREGHGVLDMKGAIQISCNPYFMQLIAKLGAYPVVELADKLGFGRETELADSLVSAAGYLPDMEDLQNPGDVANFGFGQGKLLATPVQLAQLVSLFANGGYAVTPRLVAGTTDDTGKTIASATDQIAPQQIISTKTADMIKEFMINVVENGSGKEAKPKVGSAGGKTGSAQTGVYNEDDVEIVHAWFTGFYPAQNPKYAIVVLAENGQSGGDISGPVFKEIADQIALLEQIS